MKEAGIKMKIFRKMLAAVVFSAGLFTGTSIWKVSYEGAFLTSYKPVWEML